MTNDFNDPTLSVRIVPRIASTRLGPLEYAEFGTGPAVVAVHGAMGGYDQSVILAQTAGVPGYRYLCPSRPGFLGTPLSSGERPEDQADRLAAWLEALGVETAVVMGISGGGPSVLQFALRHADRCKGLVLVSACARPVRVAIPVSFRLRTWLARFPWLVNHFRRKVERDPAAVAARSIRDPAVLAATVNDAETWPLFRAMLSGVFGRMTERLAGTTNDIAISRMACHPLDRVSVPTLVIHGTRDRVAPFTANAAIGPERIVQAELLAVEGGEHVTIFTHRELVRERIGAFLSRCTAA